MPNGKLTAYSGMTTKIRAMRKRLLTPEDYEEITHIPTVPDLIVFLQKFPTYAGVLADIDAKNAHRGEVESRMTFSTYSDFSRIYHFAGNAQKKYLEFYFMQYEVSVLKACMRNVMDSRGDVNPVLTDAHFKRHCKFDMDSLLLVTNMEDFVNVLSGTIYENPLRQVQSRENPKLFDYEMALDLSFFTHIWRHPELYVPNGELKYFQNSFGTQIDLLNILWIYRCKNYYTLSESQIYSCLIPASYHLDRSQIKAFVEAENNSVLFDFIKNSYYGRVYGFDSAQSMESQFGGILHTIYTKDFKAAPYSLAAINDYFSLKNLEIAKVVTALECIRYGYEPEVIAQYIEQKRGVL